MEVLPIEIVEEIWEYLDLNDILMLSQAYKFKWLPPTYSRTTYPHIGLSTFDMRLSKKPRRIQMKLVASDAMMSTGRWRVTKSQLEEAWQTCQLMSPHSELMWCDNAAGKMGAWLEEGLGGGDKFLKGQVRTFGSELEIEIIVIY